MKDITQLAQRRRTLLFLNGIGFSVMQLTRLDMLTSTEVSKLIWSGVLLVGAALWIATLLPLLRFSTKKRFTKSELAALNDELTQHNRLLGLQTGFIAAMATTVCLMILNDFLPISANDVLILILVAGVSGTIFRFAVLEGEDTDRE